MTEKRTAWLLAALLAGQLLLLSVQAPASVEGAGGGNFLESSFLRGVAPVTRAVAAAVGAVRNFAQDWGSRKTLVRENEDLRRRLQKLEMENQRLSELQQELMSLSRALEYQRLSERDLRVADVVYADHSSWFKTFLLYVGDEPAQVNQPVISAEGLVGRVVEAVPGYAKVQLITDRSAAVGAMVRRTRRQGVVRAGPAGLKLDFLPQQADVRAGDRVVTSGIDGIYPRGLPVGVVTSVRRGDELFYDIQVEPAVDFGLLNQVYLLSVRPLPEM